ncbi:hypothetical protein CC79DRAFT_1337338 [Sarocladium strictum]
MIIQRNFDPLNLISRLLMHEITHDSEWIMSYSHSPTVTGDKNLKADNDLGAQFFVLQGYYIVYMLRKPCLSLV